MQIVPRVTAQWDSLEERALWTSMSAMAWTLVWVARHVGMNSVDIDVNVHLASLGRIVERTSMSAPIIRAWTAAHVQMKLEDLVAVARTATLGKHVGT